MHLEIEAHNENDRNDVESFHRHIVIDFYSLLSGLIDAKAKFFLSLWLGSHDDWQKQLIRFTPDESLHFEDDLRFLRKFYCSGCVWRWRPLSCWCWAALEVASAFVCSWKLRETEAINKLKVSLGSIAAWRNLWLALPSPRDIIAWETQDDKLSQNDAHRHRWMWIWHELSSMLSESARKDSAWRKANTEVHKQNFCFTSDATFPINFNWLRSIKSLALFHSLFFLFQPTMPASDCLRTAFFLLFVIFTFLSPDSQNLYRSNDFPPSKLFDALLLLVCVFRSCLLLVHTRELKCR